MSVESVRSGMAILSGDSVWITFAAPWWDLRAWLGWWLARGEKRWMSIRCSSRGVRGEPPRDDCPGCGHHRVRIRAICVAEATRRTLSPRSNFDIERSP